MTISDALRLAMTHHQAGRVDEAVAIYRAVLAAEARQADALHLLGVVEQQRGRHEAAIELFRQASEARPSAAEFQYNLGNSLMALKRHVEAIGAFNAAARLNPKLFEARHNLGAALMLDGRSNEAADAFSAAIVLKPDSPEAHNNLGLALKDQGEIADAIVEFTRASDLRPGYHHANSNRLYAMHFDPGASAAEIDGAHRQWAIRHAGALADELPPPRIDHTVGRRLRVGFVSPDLRDHPVGRSMLPLIDHLDRGRFEIVCYADAPAGDLIARRLRDGASAWHDTSRLSDARLAGLIRAQEIDILVDLILHMNRNRLLTFARRPAPVQATFIGYPASTGLRQMDFRITDRFLDPPGETEAHNSEQLIRLPDSFWCYVPDEQSPPAGEPPVQRQGFVTFGSLNNPCKINDQVIDAWARVLHAAPASRLMLHVIEKQHIGDRFRRKFAARDVDPGRLSFVSRQPRAEYLQQFNQIDVALDPFPYNGHMTSCDALWMGAAVVSLRGRTSVGRGGESLLANLDLTRYLARSVDEYVRIATELAGNVDMLATLRRELRQRMLDSPLTHQERFAAGVGVCLTQMWELSSQESR